MDSPLIVGQSGGAAVIWEKEPPEANPEAPFAQWVWKRKDLTDLLPDPQATGLQNLTDAFHISNTGWITAKGVDHEDLRR
ncbi:MAG: hypothetical protein AAGA18_03425 [Verrucomicrobiota bacterium]